MEVKHHLFHVSRYEDSAFDGVPNLEEVVMKVHWVDDRALIDHPYADVLSGSNLERIGI